MSHVLVYALYFVLVLAGLVVAVLAGMIAFGTSNPPPVLASINNPFEELDFSDLPAIERVPARDGSSIAFRHWKPASADATPLPVIAIHGSSGSSTSLHVLAKALSAEGMAVYAPDIRGHGETGRRGDIDHAGQLDDDLEDFAAAVRSRHSGKRPVLLGFSSGGGFALHAAASRFGGSFERVVLLSPVLDPRAPTVRQEGVRAWARPFIPRFIGLSVLNGFGIHAFDGLPVINFAIDPAKASLLTGTYSFRLLKAFSSGAYAADLKNSRAPLQILVGSKDEIFYAELFAPTVHAIRPDVPVSVIPGLSHIGMTIDPRAFPAIAAALRGRP
jgi:non-heme chloroperoxidase